MLLEQFEWIFVFFFFNLMTFDKLTIGPVDRFVVVMSRASFSSCVKSNSKIFLMCALISKLDM